MANPTPFNIDQYLASTETPYHSIEQLTGGTANLVWRLTSPSGSSGIIKHAEPYVAANPSIPFPVDRMDFEYRALKTIPDHLAADSHIRIPEVHAYDAGQHVLTITDGGPRALKDAYTDPAIDIPKYGRRLGIWLRGLHDRTKEVDVGDNVTAKTIYRHAYVNVSAAATRFDLDPKLGERVDAEYGSLLATDDDCVCHGDFWPGNVLVGEKGMTIVDWEMVRRGCGATDVGQFAAEAWLLDRFREKRGLLGGFLAGYKRDEKLKEAFVRRVVVHMGVHLAFWPSRVSWGDDAETRGAVCLGNEMMRVATDEGWRSWLRESLVRELLD